MTTIATTGTVNIVHSSSSYTYDDGGIEITSFPVTLINTDPMGAPLVVNLFFTYPIESINVYFIIGSNNIIIDGKNIPMILTDTLSIGLIHNGEVEVTPYTNIFVRNIHLSCDTVLEDDAGWICAAYFGNCRMSNCSSTGNINTGGGIFGSNCTDCTAEFCSSTGMIYNGGGIYADYCSNCTAVSCKSAGNIVSGGGIFGNYTSNCTATLCFSIGPICNDAGGIFGYATNYEQSNATSTATQCYSTGEIGYIEPYLAPIYGCGGIFADNCNFNAANSLCSAIDCYSFGDIKSDHEGSGCGGIFGSVCNVDATDSDCVATRCFSVGKIGYNCGGIFHNGVKITANDCYSCGDIGEYGGGIVGASANNCTITNCYSTGRINDHAGGIIGAYCSGSLVGCYSIGTLSDLAGGLIGDVSTGITITNCYTTTETLYSAANTSDSFGINNSVAENDSWNDDNAGSTLGFSGEEHWISPKSNTPYLLMTHNKIRFIPLGHRYLYFIDSSYPVVDNTISAKTLIGYYRDEPETDTTIGTDIYGYTIKDHTMNVVVGDGPTIRYVKTGQKVTYRRFKPIWSCNSESFTSSKI